MTHTICWRIIIHPVTVKKGNSTYASGIWTYTYRPTTRSNGQETCLLYEPSQCYPSTIVRPFSWPHEPSSWPVSHDSTPWNMGYTLPKTDVLAKSAQTTRIHCAWVLLHRDNIDGELFLAFDNNNETRSIISPHAVAALVCACYERLHGTFKTAPTLFHNYTSCMLTSVLHECLDFNTCNHCLAFCCLRNINRYTQTDMTFEQSFTRSG